MRVLLFAAALAAVTPRPPALSVSEVAPGVFAVITDPADASAGGNAGFVVGADAVLVVDAAGSPEGAERLLSEVRARTRPPVRFAVLTHLHSDHMGGAAVLAKAGAVVVAHENVRAWARREWQTDLDEAARSRYAALRLPDIAYRDRVTVDLGGRIVDVFHRPGHSGSDSLIAVPDAKVLFCGDLVQKRTIPGLTFANTEAWVDTLEGLLRDYREWTFVPGHGSLAKGLDVRLFRDYLTGLRFSVGRALKEGKSGASLLETVKPQLAAKYSAWAEFSQADRNIEDMEKELTGTKVYPPAPPR
jgi:glyoxylase-like metal-dependent hydrolase (beta-lactamase superfamily II)